MKISRRLINVHLQAYTILIYLALLFLCTCYWLPTYYSYITDPFNYAYSFLLYIWFIYYEHNRYWHHESIRIVCMLFRGWSSTTFEVTFRHERRTLMSKCNLKCYCNLIINMYCNYWWLITRSAIQCNSDHFTIICITPVTCNLAVIVTIFWFYPYLIINRWRNNINRVPWIYKAE